MWIEKLQVEIIETRNRHRIDSGGLSVNTAASRLIFHSPFLPQDKREGIKDFFFLNHDTRSKQEFKTLGSKTSSSYTLGQKFCCLTFKEQ